MVVPETSGTEFIGSRDVRAGGIIENSSENTLFCGNQFRVIRVIHDLLVMILSRIPQIQYHEFEKSQSVTVWGIL